MKDPNNWEANFYVVYYKAASCKKGQISNEAYNVTNCLKSTIKLLIEALGTGDEAKTMIATMQKDLAILASSMIRGAQTISEFSYIGQVLMMQEMLGRCLQEYPDFKEQAINAYKAVIKTYIEDAQYGKVEISYSVIYGYSPEQTIELIYDLDPSYEDPFGFTKKYRSTTSTQSSGTRNRKDVLTPEEEKKNIKWSIVCAIFLIVIPLLGYLLHCLILNY